MSRQYSSILIVLLSLLHALPCESQEKVATD